MSEITKRIKKSLMPKIELYFGHRRAVLVAKWLRRMVEMKLFHGDCSGGGRWVGEQWLTKVKTDDVTVSFFFLGTSTQFIGHPTTPASYKGASGGDCIEA